MRWFLATLALAACGGAPRAGDTGTSYIKNYSPLGHKADAKSRQQAVILGTDTNNGSTVLHLPAAPAKAAVDAMFVKIDAGTDPATGGMTPVKLSASPTTDGSVEVGVYEEFANGTGTQWRAGVWMSALVAASTLGKDLTDYAFAASSGGYIDGPSASGLMAAGFLAAMTGAPIDPTATMTGAINPDGTIGPVGGIPEKFLGSIAQGKRKLGYPIGMRWAKSEVTGKAVDLVQLAKDHGAQAIEIADVHQAYTLLTGKQLPDTVPVSEAEMAIDPDTAKRLEASYQDWQRLIAGQWATIVELHQSGRLPTGLVSTVQCAEDRYKEAQQLHTAGKVGAAFLRMIGAWSCAASAVDTYDVLTKIRAGDTTGALTQIDAYGQLLKSSEAVFATIGEQKPTTLGGYLQMLGSFETALRGAGFEGLADQALITAHTTLTQLATKTVAQLGAPEVADQVVAVIQPAAVLVSQAVGEATLATQELDLANAHSVSYVSSLPNVHRMATSYSSAAVAGLTYFDALLVQPFMESQHLTEQEARARVANAEPSYLVAYLGARIDGSEGVPKQLKDTWGEQSLAWNLFNLAASQLAYASSAELIAKYYSLGVHTGSDGKVQSLEYDKAFTNMLALAERGARSSARAARIATGAIPIQAKLAYEVATVERDGDVVEQIEALGQFWASSAISQTAVMLARN
jgi:uncharacterized protein